MASPQDAPLRPAVRDFTGGAAGHVIEWDVRPVYDFLFSLTGEAGATDDLPAEDRRWVEAARAALTERERELYDRMAQTEVAIHLAAFVVEHRSIETADALVAAFEAAGPVPLLQSVFSEAAASNPAIAPALERAFGGDKAAIEELETGLPHWHRKERLHLLADPDTTHREIVALTRAWADSFRPIEGRVMEILARDFDLRAGDRTTLTGPDLIERTTENIR